MSWKALFESPTCAQLAVLHPHHNQGRTKNLKFDTFVGQDIHFISIWPLSLFKWDQILQVCSVECFFFIGWNIDIQSLTKWNAICCVIFDISGVHCLPKKHVQSTFGCDHLSSVTSFSNIPKVSIRQITFFVASSYLNCSCSWKWRMIIAVNFPI